MQIGLGDLVQRAIVHIHDVIILACLDVVVFVDQESSFQTTIKLKSTFLLVVVCRNDLQLL